MMKPSQTKINSEFGEMLAGGFAVALFVAVITFLGYHVGGYILRAFAAMIGG
jgi:hypothetical protein